MFAPLRADVAQLVEQRFRKPQVTGSNPVVGSAFAMTDLLRPANSVSIIVPTLNEEENIAPLVAQITACAVPFREILFFFFSSRRRHTRLTCDWSSDVCSSD